MIPPLILVECLLIILQFDGSLRPPRDRGFPSHKLGRLASCSAVLLSDDRCRVLAMGGQMFPLEIGMTSADAEFQGLLLGLEFLCQIQQTLDIDTKITLPLLVEGDCKAVIDIMNHDAFARKLASKYDDASRFVVQLGLLNMQFHHIPRELNQLSDSLCQHVTQFAVEQNLKELTDLLESQAMTVIEILNEYFGDGSIIPFSLRLSVHGILLKYARESGDIHGLLHLGKQIESEAKFWSTNDNQMPCKQSLMSLAIHIQLEAYCLLGKHKEASRLRRRYRDEPEKQMRLETDIGTLDAWKRSVESHVNCGDCYTTALVSWAHYARGLFLNGESMRRSKRTVWKTTFE